MFLFNLLYSIKQYIDCHKACKALNGTYWYNGCSVTVYLSHVCLRVSQNDSQWIPDYPPFFFIVRFIHRQFPLSKNQVGCDKYNGYSPGYYVDYDPHLQSIPVMIRSYQDGYIAASEFADDCDSDGENCFGLSASEFQARFIFWLVYFIIGICGCIFALLWKPYRCQGRLVKVDVDGSGDGAEGTTDNTVNKDIEKQAGEVENDSLHKTQDELNTTSQEPSNTSHQEPSNTSHQEPSNTSHQESSGTSHQESSGTSHQESSGTTQESSGTSHQEPSGTSHQEPSNTSHQEPSNTSHQEPSNTSHQ